ncbi:MAG: GDSL-type esterase/lipase family protein [Gemmataceae bacterium]
MLFVYFYLAFLPLLSQQPPSPPATPASSAGSADPFAKWEKEIAGIEKKREQSGIEPGGVTFVGSSTIRLWDLKKSFPGKPYFNAGFGGSVTADATHFVPRIVLPQKPSIVVFYSGDNDINNKRTAEQVRDDTRAFVRSIHETLPKTKIIILGIKPSVARVKQVETQKKANDFVKADCEKNPLLRFIDPVPLILGNDGKPIPSRFQKDGLHLSDEGYALIAREIQALISEK